MRPTSPLGDHAAVLVPGLGLTGAAWAPTVQALVEQGLPRGSVRVELLPGYGAPADEEDRLGARALSRRILEALPRERTCVLFGHSASCQIVTHAAASAPDRVAGLVLVGPTTDPRSVTWPRLAGRWLGTAVHEPPWQLPTLVRAYSRSGLGNARRSMDRLRSDRIELTLEEVTCPVLVLRGRHDRIAPEDWVRTLAAGRPADRPADRPVDRPAGRRTAVTLATGAHMVPLTRGQAVADAVAAFFADEDRTSAHPAG